MFQKKITTDTMNLRENFYEEKLLKLNFDIYESMFFVISATFFLIGFGMVSNYKLISEIGITDILNLTLLILFVSFIISLILLLKTYFNLRSYYLRKLTIG